MTPNIRSFQILRHVHAMSIRISFGPNRVSPIRGSHQPIQSVSLCELPPLSLSFGSLSGIAIQSLQRHFCLPLVFSGPLGPVDLTVEMCLKSIFVFIACLPSFSWSFFLFFLYIIEVALRLGFAFCSPLSSLPLELSL